MHPKVRDLYRRFLVAGTTYPQGLEVVRRRAKQAFFANAALKDEIEIKRAVAKGRYWVREIQATGMLHKYRAMKHRYS